MNTSSIRELGANLGASAVHRVVLFGISLLTLFFLFRHGESISIQCRTASQKLFGERGERVALQMVASVHGTVAGLILVAIGEGILLGVVYFLTKLPHPILFGDHRGTLWQHPTRVCTLHPGSRNLTDAAAHDGRGILVPAGDRDGHQPFPCLGQAGGVGPALIVLLAGFAVIFVADHFVRPKLIGGATKLPFLWVLLGILGGVESFQLFGLFLGPAIMAALMLLWRQLTTLPADQRDALFISEQTDL